MLMLWTLPLFPILVGLGVWALGRARTPSRLVLGGVAVSTTGVLIALAAWATSALPTASFAWGAGLALELEVTPVVGAMALIIPSIALPVLMWASGHEEHDALARLVGLVLAFVGSMELLVLAADLLTLTIGWELVGALSWALIGHDRGDDQSRKDAAYAYNATRLGGLGLFLAAGAAVAATGSFAYADLGQVASSAWGGLFAAGILVAAASKSAQLPFSPWLFRAMAGPTSVSALLHSATMVAAGAWVLIRLHEPLSRVDWFGGVAIGVGLATAIAGGIVAAAQPRAKRLLAASTSAHYGFMFAAVGAGAASAAMAHLGTHAAFKSLLFLVAGTAMGVAGSHKLREMRLGRLLPLAAAASAVGALALAGIPPLGGAWSKEKVLAGLGHTSLVLALVGIGAAALSAWYAARFHFLAYGRDDSRQIDAEDAHWPGSAERIGMAILALATLALSALWLPSVSKPVADALAFEWPSGKLWEKITAGGVAVLAALGAWLVYRPGKAHAPEDSKLGRRAADWLMLPTLLDRLVVRPTLALADGCARFDDRVVDAGVRGSARLGRLASTIASRGLEVGVDWLVEATAAATVVLGNFARVTDDELIDGAVEGSGRTVGKAAEPVRRTQTGAVPRYYVYVTGGLFLLVCIALLWR